MLSCDVQRTKFFSNKVFRLQREYPPSLQRDFCSLALIYMVQASTLAVLLMQPLTRVMSYHAICQVVELEYLSATSKGC